MRLYHASDQADIDVFEPRIPPTPSPATAYPVVWAVDEPRLVNYLVPRECPRVTFYASPTTNVSDRLRFFGNGPLHPVVAIEAGWVQRAIDTALWVYEFPSHSFACIDQSAGYFVSRVSVTAISRRLVASPLMALASAGAELRVLPSLHALAAEVAGSSLAFSCIRMRNAAS
jgi:hypothetical protein